MQLALKSCLPLTCLLLSAMQRYSSFPATMSQTQVPQPIYLHRCHQYAGALPITVETYFLTFELLLPAGQQGGRSHHATNYESGAKCSADIRAVLAPPSGSAVAAGLRSCLVACLRLFDRLPTTTAGFSPVLGLGDRCGRGKLSRLDQTDICRFSNV